MRIPENDLAWASLTRTELWKQINSEAVESFDYALAWYVMAWAGVHITFYIIHCCR